MSRTNLIPDMFDDDFGRDIIKASFYAEQNHVAFLGDENPEELEQAAAGWIILAEARLRQMRGTLNSYFKKILDSLIPSWFDVLEKNDDTPATLLMATLQRYNCDIPEFKEEVIVVYCDEMNYVINHGTVEQKEMFSKTFENYRKETPSFPNPPCYFGPIREKRGFAVKTKA